MSDMMSNLRKNVGAFPLMSMVVAAMLFASPLHALNGHFDDKDSDRKGCDNCTSQPKEYMGGHSEAEAVPGDPYILNVDPVSGEELGESPAIVNIDGREIRFASDKSIAQFKENPKRYLHTIDQMMIKQQLPRYPLDTCVISGEKLGSMGEPINFVYTNQLVRLCCGGCKNEFSKDPVKNLAKIDDAVVAKQKKDYPLVTCVVSDEKLGGDMGEPIEYVAGNQLVRLCCKGCKKQFNKTPLVFLGKISQASKNDHVQKESNTGSGSGHDHSQHGQH